MIQDHTIDQALVELARTMKALKALRAALKCADVTYDADKAAGKLFPRHPSTCSEHAAALRASMDLTRKLADLRQGR